MSILDFIFVALRCSAWLLVVPAWYARGKMAGAILFLLCLAVIAWNLIDGWGFPPNGAY